MHPRCQTMQLFVFCAVWVRLAADIPPRATGPPQDLVGLTISCGETRKDIVLSLTRTAMHG